MSLSAIIPVASLLAANQSLEAAGYGPRNFSLDSYGATGPTHAALHTWRTDDAFAAAVKALPGVVYDDAVSDPVAATAALIQAQGAQWGEYVPELPNLGMTVAGQYYKHRDPMLLWLSIVAFSRDIYSGEPETLSPSIIRRIARPGAVVEWWQPLDQFDACKLVNPFTGLPDRRTKDGKTWEVSQADGAGNNTYPPGVWGWVEVGGSATPAPEPEPPQQDEWPEFVHPTGAHDTYAKGAKVTFNGAHYVSKIDNNAYSPDEYPAGWDKQ